MTRSRPPKPAVEIVALMTVVRAVSSVIKPPTLVVRIAASVIEPLTLVVGIVSPMTGPPTLVVET